MSELVCYKSEQIRGVWPQVRDHIKRALDRGSNYTLTNIYVGLRKNRMQLWTSQHGGYIEAALVTSIQDGYCLLLAAGGENLEQWIGWLPIVEDWAKENGATEFRIYGRIGWLRRLNGFRAEYTKMVKQL